MEPTSKIGMNGELVDWADATVHVGTHALHYGTGVFEGIRAYETDTGTAVFRLTDHLEGVSRNWSSADGTERAAVRSTSSSLQEASRHLVSAALIQCARISRT